MSSPAGSSGSSSSAAPAGLGPNQGTALWADAAGDPWSGPGSPASWSSPVSLIRLEGPDSRRFLHGQSSQALETAAPGACLATCLITPTARLRGLALALVDDTGLDLVGLEGEGAALHQALDRVLFPADRVRLDPPQPARLVRLAGPLPAQVPLGSPGQWQPLAAGAGLLLQPEVSLGGTAASPAVLLRSGDEQPAWLKAFVPLDADAWALWRLGQGFPAAPGEINDGCNPFELGLAGWVSLNKGCYVGQETLAKLATYDGVKQQLRRWIWRAAGAGSGPGSDLEREALSPGSGLVTAAGERAGVITSVLHLAAAGPAPAVVIGLALVRRAALAETRLLAADLPLEISTPAAFQAPPVGAGKGP
ncbi:MAG: aminomethyltransferase [Cyanobacteria bacterium]|nr:aminomethyltransferase [Cyanobacteriota bacterium]